MNFWCTVLIFTFNDTSTIFASTYLQITVYNSTSMYS
jgi:hypothetical protein